jgi:hypothetical protein
MSGSASFHSARKSLLAAPAFVVSPSIPYERATPVAPMRQSGIQHHAGMVDDFLEFRARLLAAVPCEVGFASQAGGARLQSDWCMAVMPPHCSTLLCGCAVHSRLTASQAYATLELKVAYYKPVTKDTGLLRAEGQLLSFAQTVAFEAKLTDTRGKLYASATSTLLVFNR